MRHSHLAGLAVLAVLGTAPPLAALPTMIRLGYTNCAACHISPQGAGLLNSYGRGIDEAQSLRAGEYQPSENSLIRTLSWGGRITQDVRTVVQEQVSTVGSQPAKSFFRPRFMYRNVTELGKGFRFSGTVTGETESAARPALSYDPAVRPRSVFVNTALMHYRAAKTLEITAGRDQLPTGINIPDLAFFIRSRNRLGYYDAPAQLKMYWWGKRYHVSPFAFGPGGNEPAGERESGAGTLAEIDVFGKQRTVVGVSLLRGSAVNGDRRMSGLYTRLGFGKWGILAEHDITGRARHLPEPAAFRQDTTYGQVFWAIREWLVASGFTERLHVQRPFEEHLVAGKAEVVARLASQATVGVGVRIQRDVITGRLSKALVIQAAFKTVN